MQEIGSLTSDQLLFMQGWRKLNPKQEGNYLVRLKLVDNNGTKIAMSTRAFKNGKWHQHDWERITHWLEVLV